MCKLFLLIVLFLLFSQRLAAQDYYYFFERSMIFEGEIREIWRNTGNDSILITLYLDEEDGAPNSQTIHDSRGNIIKYLYDHSGAHINIDNIDSLNSLSGLAEVQWRGDSLVLYHFYNGESGFIRWEKKMDGSVIEMSNDSDNKSSYVEYYPSGKIYKKGVGRDSISIYSVFYENGQLMLEYSTLTYYSSAPKVNKIKFYDNTGVLSVDGNYLSPEFWIKTYNESESLLEYGIRDGAWKYYTKKGKLYKTETYKLGELISTKEKKIWNKKNRPQEIDIE